MLTTAIKCHSLPFTLRVRGITLHIWGSIYVAQRGEGKGYGLTPHLNSEIPAVGHRPWERKKKVLQRKPVPVWHT